MFRTEYLTFYNKLEHEVKYLQSFQNEENYWTVLSETFKLVYWIWKLTFEVKVLFYYTYIEKRRQL